MFARSEKRKRQEPQGGEGNALASKQSSFSSTQYLIQHGWQGAGVPLDGANGKGLKKPLALPQKRDVKGIGKNRDRAVEWWDCLFEASAKSLATGTSSNQSSVTPSIGPKLSLEATARREVLRRQLMSSFIRGEVIGGIDPIELAAVNKPNSSDNTRENTVSSNTEKKKDKKQSRKAKRLEEIAAAQALLECELAV